MEYMKIKAFTFLAGGDKKQVYILQQTYKIFQNWNLKTL